MTSPELTSVISRRVVGWATSIDNDRFLATGALGKAVPADHDAAERIIHDYIDAYQSTKRRRSFIDYECPVGFELKCQLAAVAA